MDTELNQAHRKDQHVGLANRFYVPEPTPDLAATRLVHHPFPELDVADIDSQTTIAGMTLAQPFFINAITGGSPATTALNARLATLSRETGLAMATGSVSIAMKDASAASSFANIRAVNPDGLVFANLGAHHGLENAKRAVDLLGANALQIHVNVPQEIVMPEGERSFTDWLRNVETIVAGLDVPVIVKEVGFGMSRETVATLRDLGVQAVDVSGTGGTNFAQIENARRTAFKYDILEDWGQSTVVSLLEAGAVADRPSLIASGGVRTSLDIVKCLTLGADAVGLSGQFLHLLRQPDSLDTAIQTVLDMQAQVRDIMTLLGAKTVADLRKTDVVLPSDVAHWCEARGMDWQSYAQRRNLS